MPYLIAADPRSLDRGAGSAIAEGGRRLTELSVQFAKLKDTRDREREEHKLRLERLELERQRAEALLAQRKGTADQRTADVQGAIQGIEEEGARATEQAGQVGFRSSMADTATQGLLGPFGLVTAGARGAAERAKMQTKVQHDVEVASLMSPEGARAHLASRKALYAREALQSGYESAKSMIERGSLTEEEGGDAVLDEAAARELNATLQTAIAEGESADGVIQAIGKRYKAHGALRVRAAAWEKADAQAQELLAAADQLGAQAPEGVDPVTGKNAKADVAKRIARAEAEWAQTQYPNFRMRNDPATSLGALKKLVLEGEAEADPAGFIREQGRGANVRRRAVGDEAQDAYEQGEAAERAGLQGRVGRSQSAPGAGQAPGVPRGAPEGQATARGKPGVSWAKLQPAQRKGLEDELLRAASVGAPVRELLDSLGLDPASVPPELQRRILEATRKAQDPVARRFGPRPPIETWGPAAARRR